MALIAILSDIPIFIAQWLTRFTGIDTSGLIDIYNDVFSGMIEAFEQLLS